MSWVERKKEITKADYDAINKREKNIMDFFEEWEIAGYGAIPSNPVEREGKYYIPYGISTSCD